MKLFEKLAILVCVCVTLSASYAWGNGVQPDEAAAAEQSERCSLVPDPGPCKALFEKYYYNPQSKKCNVFFYGGCQGVVPFETMEECAAACENPAELRIASVAPDNNLPFAMLYIEYPKEGDEPEFDIQVNGEKAVVYPIGGGFDQESRDKTFLLALGETGNKEILVTASSETSVLTARTEYYWIAPGKIELLSVAGENPALFEQVNLNLYVFGVQNVTLSFNGESVQPEKKEIDAVRGAVLNINPTWKKGRNTLSIEAVGGDGKVISKQYTFYYMPEKNLAKGDSATIEYGYPGSKSGPFFYIESEGAAIRLTDQGETVTYILNEDDWLMPDYRLTAKIEGVEPGTATVRIFKKNHFTEARGLDKEITFTVVP